METKIKAIVSYRAGRDSRGRLIRSALELETTVPVPATLRQIGESIAPVVAAKVTGSPNASFFAYLVVDQVCVYHRGSFIGSLTPQRS